MPKLTPLILAFVVIVALLFSGCGNAPGYLPQCSDGNSDKYHITCRNHNEIVYYRQFTACKWTDYKSINKAQHEFAIHIVADECKIVKELEQLRPG